MHHFIHLTRRLAGIGFIVSTTILLIAGALSSQMSGSVYAAPLLTATSIAPTQTVGAATPTTAVTLTATATPSVTPGPSVTPTVTITPEATPLITVTDQPVPTASVPLTSNLQPGMVWLPMLNWDDLVVEAPITDTWTITDIATITDTVTITETPLITDEVTITDDLSITETIEVTPSALLSNAVEYTPTLLINNRNVIGIESVGFQGAEAAKLLAESGAGWTREANFNWSQVEPNEGERRWDAVAEVEDRLIQANARGIKVILVVLRQPIWAQKVVGSGCGPIRADKLTAFANFMRDAVIRYSAPPFNVKYWEIGNEPDAPTVRENKGWGCWGNPADAYYGGAEYARMLKAIYPSIKLANPNAQVILGGQLANCDPIRPPAGMNCRSTRFFEGALRGGGGPFFDGVGFHAYEYYTGSLGKWGSANWWSAYNTTGPVLAVKARYYKRLLTAYRVTGKFLMDTEGALLCNNCDGNAQFELTKAYYMPEMYAAGMSEGLQAVSFYGLRSGWLGGNLFNSSGQPLPAYQTIQIATSKLGNATYIGKVVGTDTGGVTGVMGYKFVEGTRKVWLVRSLSSRIVTLKLANLPTRISDPFGKPITPTKTLAIGGMPMYVEWDN